MKSLLFPKMGICQDHFPWSKVVGVESIRKIVLLSYSS